MVKLLHPGSYTVYNKEGLTLQYYIEGKNYIDDAVEDNLIAIGIWDDSTQTLELWEDVYPQILAGTYVLPELPYLDNGQVIEEGRILSIEVTQG